jgi:hypothetical protein
MISRGAVQRSKQRTRTAVSGPQTLCRMCALPARLFHTKRRGCSSRFSAHDVAKCGTAANCDGKAVRAKRPDLLSCLGGGGLG